MRTLRQRFYVSLSSSVLLCISNWLLLTYRHKVQLWLAANCFFGCVPVWATEES